ncbi:MAG: sugar phosphate isomerase/epimerase [Terricaulis sp.]
MSLILPNLSRRTLLTGASATLAFAALPGCTPPAAPVAAVAAKKIGIQLYTLRAAMEQDVAGTLGRVADIGYDEVEFAGYFNTPASEIKRLLGTLNLTAPSAHVQPADMRDKPQEVIDAAKEIGHEYLVFPWLPPEQRVTLDLWRATADFCNTFAQQCQTAGLKFAYHNHDFEFQPIDGVVPYNLLRERCDPALVKFELDLYWASKAGQDPNTVLASDPGRFPMCHVKDMDAAGEMADVGAGTIDFAAIFAANTFEHYFVEHDATTDPFASAETSFTALTALLAAPQPA